MISQIYSYNQLVDQDTTVTDERKFVVNTTTTSTTRCVYTAGQTISSDHKVFLRIQFKSNFTNRPFFRYSSGGNYYSATPTSYVTDQWCEIVKIIDGLTPGSSSGILPNNNNYIQGEYFSLPKDGGFIAIDLTLMFGAGNEPTLEEMLIMFPYLNYPYNTGEYSYL